MSESKVKKSTKKGIMEVYYIFDENKKIIPVELDEYLAWSEKNKKRHVADEIIAGYRVSTVFLVLDHRSHYYQSAPVLFETMIFDADGHDAFEYQERCSTWCEAEQQHIQAVEFVRKKQELHHA